MRIHLVRHGHTIWNDTGGVAGRTDIDLSVNGQQAVSKLARTWRAEDVVHSWHSSPLLRTRETTRLLTEGMTLRAILPVVQPDERLVELDFGDWEGMTWQSVHELFQEEMELWGQDWVNRSPPNGETFAQQAVRCGDYLQELVSNSHVEDNAMVVLHGGSIRALVCHCLGWPLSRGMQFSIDPATVTTLDLNHNNGQWTLRKINSSSFSDHA